MIIKNNNHRKGENCFIFCFTMKRYKRLLYLLGILGIVFSQSILGQSSYVFHHLDTSNGLSNNTVKTILRDSYGFLWIGTEAGLNRYDGYGFKVYTMPSDTHNPSISNDILELQEDGLGNIWVDFGYTYMVYKREKDYYAPVCAHYGFNNIPTKYKKPCDEIKGCTFCDSSKIKYIDELDDEDNVFKRMEKVEEDNHIVPEVQWKKDGMVSVTLFIPENIETSEAAAIEMGYRHNKFASNLRQNRTNTIGVVVPKLNSYFMATAIAGIEKITNLHGYGLIITQSQESGKKEVSCVSTLYNSRVDGLLVSLAFDTNSSDHLEILLNNNTPVVFFDRVFECSDCMSVIIDNYKAGYEATSHLIAEGCRRIVHITGNLSRNVYAERYRGYKQALADNNIIFEQDLVFVSDLSEQAGTELAIKIAAMDILPDGIFAANDTSAVAAIIELQRSGLSIPEDIAVVGFNNEPACRIVKPNLSSIEYPAMNIGEIAASSLIEMLNKPQSDTLSTIVLKHSLKIRESSQKKKNQ